jgi:hydrogenase expression/formation protein HypE
MSKEFKQNPKKKYTVKDEFINLAHGSGGKAMHELIEGLFLDYLQSPLLKALEDQAVFELSGKTGTSRLAFTTDSYVVSPIIFPGGDIGKLAVAGTVNDLAMSGAKPLYLSVGFILEEGFPIKDLKQILASMRDTATEAGVEIVTGDTKVVQRGGVDKIFINTSGIGIINHNLKLSASRACVGDKVILSGTMGDHGTTILIARGELELESEIQSDVAPLWSLVEKILECSSEIHVMRDPTRGGVATTLNEIACSSNVCIQIKEALLPIREEVKGACEILGLDPLYIGNEGKLIAIVGANQAELLVRQMQQHPLGSQACIIGEVIESPQGMVVMKTAFGGTRIVDMLVGEQLPRIC